LNQVTVDFEKFLMTNIAELDEDLVLYLMQTHGRLHNCLEFAQKKGNFEILIIHYINQEEYGLAIEMMKKIHHS
jgi:hypothetical protein